MLSLKKLGSPWSPPRTLSYNPAERAILVTSPSDGGSYELVNLPREASGAVEPTNSMRGPGTSAVFVARNRFAVFTQANQQIDIKDLSNSTTKTIKPPHGTLDMVFGGTGCLLLITATHVYLYDIQQKKQIAELYEAICDLWKWQWQEKVEDQWDEVERQYSKIVSDGRSTSGRAGWKKGWRMCLVM